MPRYVNHVLWPLFVALTFLSALFLGWQILVKVHFLYPLWYDVIDIDQTIADYGPQNRHRHGFETTTRAERVRLFAAIVGAVQRRGEGLDALTYHDPSGRPIASLLTPPEVIHLQDVAHLVRNGVVVGWGALLGWLLLVGLLSWHRLLLPPIKRFLLATAATVGFSGVLILVIGPTRVFYGLHAWIFPAGHPWFFYYQDSLMTTMMQAPVLFAYIAGSWLALSLLLFVGILYGTRQWLIKFNRKFHVGTSRPKR